MSSRKGMFEGWRVNYGERKDFPKIYDMMDEFMNIVEDISQKRLLKKAVVRSRLPCSVMALVDSENLFILAQHHLGAHMSSYDYRPKEKLSVENALNIAKWEFGFTDPFLIKFPLILLKKQKKERKTALEAIALVHIESEVQRMKKISSLIQIIPIFGPASYSIDNQLVFVLMPFEKELTKIYKSIIKPLIESLGLLCRRSDDYKTSEPIIKDIWKAICEARIIIADLTNLNPNVMYEIGIAHTIGKDTILIMQQREKEVKFPFDILHIRRIEYKDTAEGGKELETNLKETIRTLLEPSAISYS